MNKKSLGAIIPKGLNRINKICYGYLCWKQIDLSFDQLHYLGTVNFKHEDIL